MGEKHLLYIFDLFIMLNWMSTWIATHKSRRKIMSFVRYQSSARASNWTLFPRLVVQPTPTWIDLFPLGHTKHSVQMANHSKFMSFLFDKICRWFSVVFFSFSWPTRIDIINRTICGRTQILISYYMRYNVSAQALIYNSRLLAIWTKFHQFYRRKLSAWNICYRHTNILWRTAFSLLLRAEVPVSLTLQRIP